LVASQSFVVAVGTGPSSVYIVHSEGDLEPIEQREDEGVKRRREVRLAPQQRQRGVVQNPLAIMTTSAHTSTNITPTPTYKKARATDNTAYLSPGDVAVLGGDDGAHHVGEPLWVKDDHV